MVNEPEEFKKPDFEPTVELCQKMVKETKGWEKGVNNFWKRLLQLKKMEQDRK
jgi:hypothetical protein